MKMQFAHQEVELPKIKQKNNALPDGGRAYETPEGKLYPSITTVLSVRNKKGLHEWRERVGHDVQIISQGQLHKEEQLCIKCVRII